MSKQGYLEIDVFDKSSVQKAIAKMGGLNKELEQAIDTAMDILMERAYKRMLMYMGTMETHSGTLATSNLASTIVPYRINNGFVIEVEGDYALYVEFGTGVVGLDNPHPNLTMFGENWVYNHKGKGHAGWYYFDEDGTRHWTKGMPSRPFMYKTQVYINSQMLRVINHEIKKVIR